MNNFRIGHGYDVHQLIKSIPLIICGVNIESKFGSLGHSDGDIAYHSICDAILGALALGDLGTYFPSTDEKWAGANSEIFLKKILILMYDKGYVINNIDCTIILQKPSINKYILKMKKNLSSIFNLGISSISIKVTSTDKLGAIGRGEGIASSTIILLSKDNNES